MSVSILLDQNLDIQRQVVTPDASGGAVRSFGTLLSGVACSIAPASASIAADYARRDMIVNYKVYTTANLDVLPGGLQLGDRLSDGVAVYLVKGVLKSANQAVSSEVLFEILCERRLM